MLDRNTSSAAHAYMWGPIWDAASIWNTHLVESAGAISSDWQSFVDRRAHENLALAEGIGCCGTPTELWSAYAKYWQSAAEDMRSQSLAMDKRMRETLNKASAATAVERKE